MILPRAPADPPPGLRFVVDRAGGRIVGLLVIGLRPAEPDHRRRLPGTCRLGQHRKCGDDEVAVAGPARPLRWKARICERLKPDRLQIAPRGHDRLERVGVLGKAAADHHDAFGRDRAGRVRHAFELGRQERLPAEFDRLGGCGRARGRRLCSRHHRSGHWNEFGRGRRNPPAARVGANEHRLRIGSECQAPDARFLGRQSLLLSLGLYIPKLHGAVEAAGGEPRAVGGEGGRGHPVLVS